jgi:hypothetical protein
MNISTVKAILWAINEYPFFPHLLSYLGEMWYMTHSHNAVECFVKIRAGNAILSLVKISVLSVYQK